MTNGWVRQIPTLLLGFLTAAALAIHGYHYGVEDSEIFIPGAHRLLHPNLFPYGSEFFLAHQHLSLCLSPILAWTANFGLISPWSGRSFSCMLPASSPRLHRAGC